MVHVPSAHASVRTCSYIYWLVVVVVVGVGCMRDVVTSEAGDWLTRHWLAGSLARALEQWSEPTTDTAAPQSLLFWLPGTAAGLADWATVAAIGDGGPRRPGRPLPTLHHLHEMPCI